MIKLIIVLNFLIGLRCHSHSSTKNDELNQFDLDATRIFIRYTNNTNMDLMTTTQLNNFLYEFKDILLNSNYEYSKQACFRFKFNQLINQTNQLDNDTKITPIRFSRLSYFLVLLIDECFNKKTFNISHVHDDEHNTHSNGNKFTHNVFKITKEKWLYAFLSVTLISIMGLLCVLIVPVLNTYCFDYLFQFLVALALGTLCGDALLHLIPHAFVEHDESNEDSNFLDLSDSNMHSASLNVLKGLGAFLGIYIFFIIEKVVKYRENYKEKKLLENTNPINGSLNPTFVTSPKKSSRSIAKDTDQTKETKPVVPDSVELNLLEHKQLNNKADDKNQITHSHNHIGPYQTHTHTHAHSHSHNSNGMKSNALMVILGDGLHNFSDGLAIGASFASSLTAGFGTTIAVFCHELPHEIGDFAVLKKSGVSTKRAVFYNILSSVLCFIGALVGLLIGSIELLSDWSFLFIAGTFLYISLVDIIPELNESKSHSISCLILQNLGILFGLSIMLVIGLFENDIHNLIK